MIPKDPAIAAALLERLAALPADKSLDPTELARALAGTDEKAWARLMPSIRRVAVKLAGQGRAIILRKGKPVDPATFKGVYRIGGPLAADAAEPAADAPA